MTLDEYLAAWQERQRSRLQHGTWQTYTDTIRRYLSPALGPIPLTELDPMRVEQCYADLHRHGGVRGRGLSLATVRYTHAVLHKALADAVRLRMLEVNVADFAQLPRPVNGNGQRTLNVWTAQQAAQFLDLVAGERLAPLWSTALATGMRRGELLGVSWDDVDLDAGTILVHRSLTTMKGRPELKGTKTGRSRTLALDRGATDRLSAWRARQRHELRLPGTATADWQPVFTAPDGGPHLPMRVTNAWRQLRGRLPLPAIRLHDLRHTHASLLLQAGVSIKVVSERLGHRNIALTMDTYTHVLPAMDRDAADRLGDLLAAGADSRQ